MLLLRCCLCTIAASVSEGAACLSADTVATGPTLPSHLPIPYSVLFTMIPVLAVLLFMLPLLAPALKLVTRLVKLC